MLINEEIPTSFTGLVYAPSTEHEVYMLAILLLPYLPWPLVFEEFEINPKRQRYKHTKWLDAKGKKLVDQLWKPITIEFKLYSSGFLRDIERHPGLKEDRVNLIICWEDDALEVSKYVDEVVALKPIFYQLHEKSQVQIILYPYKTSKLTIEASSSQNLISRFSKANRSKVERLLALWREQTQAEADSGKAEILFRQGSRTLFRACSYKVDHIILTNYVSQKARSSMLSRFSGDRLPTNKISIPLDNIEVNDLPAFMNMIVDVQQ